MAAKNVTLSSYIDLDLKKSYGCGVKYKGKTIYITTMVRENLSYYVMLKGGDLLEINKETYDVFSLALSEHIKKVFGNKC